MDPVAKTGGSSVVPILAGLAWSFAVLIMSTLLLSLLLAVTGLREAALPVYVYFAHGISIFTGGFVAARRAGHKGWYRGGTLGVVYGLTVSLISWLGFDAAWSLDTLTFVVISFATGALGGMLGINARRR
jgi:putative membrane protein (TIGR04086 family)